MGLSDAALVAAFTGERYTPAVRLSDVIAPPYDVIDERARAALAARNPHNVVRVILPQGDADRYAEAARLLNDWRNRGVLVPDPEPALYVVEQRFTTPDGMRRTRTGVVGAVAAEPFASGRVKPHEQTHAGPKQDRLALLRSTETMCEALLMLARDRRGTLRQELSAVTASKPVARAELAGVEVALWKVGGGGAAALAAAGEEPLYIADGHHRYETAVAYRAENPRASRTLALIVPLGDPGLVVLSTHRILAGRPISEGTLHRLSPHFSIERLGSVANVPRSLDDLRGLGGGCLVVLGDAGLYRLVRIGGAAPAALKGLDPTVRSLDVAWVDGLVVPVLQEASGAQTLRYVPDVPTVLAVLQRGEASSAVLLNPPAVEEVLAVADARAVMPPKATFFTPKVPSGLVFLNYAAAPPG